jgi:peptidoglycan/xylan/chitin deacetylase (PgdA/CDA1 family)
MKNGMRKFGRDSYYRMIRAAGHWKNLLTDHQAKLLILTYHRVLPEVADDPLRIAVRSATFSRHVEALSKRFPVISLSDALEQCRTGCLKAQTQVVLTFDDGYWDNYEIAFPVLKGMGLPAVFFLPTESVKGRAEFTDPRIIDKKTGRPHNYVNNRFINWEEAKSMSDAGMEIGSHGVTHRSLAKMPAAKAREEIVKSKEIIERSLNTQCRHFAFPFGSRQDYDQSLVDCVEKTGYMSCLLNVHGYNHPETDKFCLRRIIMEESTNVAHILG